MTETSLMILNCLAAGGTVEEIFWRYPFLGYEAIGLAAREALTSLQQTQTTQGVPEGKPRYAKAFARWTDEEHEILSRGFQAGQSIKALAELLNRQPGAIRIRLEKLGLAQAEGSHRKRFPL